MPFKKIIIFMLDVKLQIWHKDHTNKQKEKQMNILDKAYYQLGDLTPDDCNVVYCAFEDAVELFGNNVTVNNVLSVIGQYADNPDDYPAFKKPSSDLQEKIN